MAVTSRREIGTGSCECPCPARREHAVVVIFVVVMAVLAVAFAFMLVGAVLVFVPLGSLFVGVPLVFIFAVFMFGLLFGVAGRMFVFGRLMIGVFVLFGLCRRSILAGGGGRLSLRMAACRIELGGRLGVFFVMTVVVVVMLIVVAVDVAVMIVMFIVPGRFVVMIAGSSWPAGFSSADMCSGMR